MAELTRYRSFIDRLLAIPPFTGFYGRRYKGVIALLFDQLAEGASQAVTAWWMKAPGGAAPDAARPLGDEMSLPRYPEETEEKHLTRLGNAWQIWDGAGSDSVLLEQLEDTLGDAGFTNPRIFRSSDPLQRTTFVVFYAPGDHPVTNAGAEWGGFIWGDGTTYGPGGITPSQIETIRAIIRKWKPGLWKCAFVLFQISGWSYGDGSAWGDPGLVYGGETAAIGV